MAFANASMLAETSTTTGTGSYALGGVPSAEYRTINAGIGTGNQGCFIARMGTTWELFYGTSSNSTTLTRDTVIRTSTGGTSAINWGAGTKTIECVYPGEKAVFLDKSPVFGATVGLNGNRLDLDADNDSYLQATADDQVDLVIANARLLRATTGQLDVRSADGGSGTGPKLAVYRDSGSPADGDLGGVVDFDGNDSGGTRTVYARLSAEFEDITDATEDGNIVLSTVRAGSFGSRLKIGGDVYTQNSAAILAGKISPSSATVGSEMRSTGELVSVVDGGTCVIVNRLSSDGTLIALQQAGTTEGSISVSGTTVAYNTFLGAHWSQWSRKGMKLPAPYSVLVMCQERCRWAGEPVDPKLPKCDVSRERGAADVYGIFAGLDEDGDVTVWALGTAPAVLVKGPVRRGYPLWTSDEPGVAEAAPEDAPWWRCLGRSSVDDAGESIRPVPVLVKAG